MNSRKYAFRSVLTNLREKSIWPSLPLSLLLLGMSTTVFFVQDRGYLYRNTWNPSYHFEWLSSHTLTIAVNLSFSHHFLGFVNQIVDAEGNIDYAAYSATSNNDVPYGYRVYNRFPPGGYFLIKLVTLPFGDDLSNQIYAARILMLALSIGTVVLAYWSLRQLISNRWIASAAILIAFSSTQWLLFNDTIVTEIGPDLFGFALTFHGIVIFEKEGRFRQLVIKSCIALLLGWHVVVLLLVFILLKLSREVIYNRRVMFGREFLATTGSRRYVILGIVVLGFSLLILAYNIGNEYYALGVRTVDQLALVDLPSLQSILFRTGLSQEGSPHSVISISFLEGQLSRIGLLSIPFVWPNSSSSYADYSRSMIVTQYLFVGIVVLGVCVIGIFLVRHRLLALTAVMAGFIWAILMRNYSVIHGFDALYYIGIPILFYTLVLLLIRKWMSERLIPLTSLVAFLIFISSSYRMGYTDRNDKAVEFHKSVVNDFEDIRGIAGEDNVFVTVSDIYSEINKLVGSAYGMQYYLSGSGVVFDNYGCDHVDEIDFIIRTSQGKVPSLTPDNRMFFLYERNTYEEVVDKLVGQDRPVVRGDFDIYLTDDRRLVYIHDRCDRNNLRNMFGVPISLAIYPVNAEDLSVSDQNHELATFNFVENLVVDTRQYFMILDLPNYDIDKIKTWQYTDGVRTWDAGFFGPDHVADTGLLQRVDRTLIFLEPIIFNHFNVYLTDDKSLIYVREPCDNNDVSDDFFLHIFPVDKKYLPQDRIQNEFNNLDFIFVDHGTRDDQRCVAEVKLPDYDIASVSTGQFTYQGQIWQSEFKVTRP